MKPIADVSDEDLRRLAEDSVTAVERFNEVNKLGGMGLDSGTEAQAVLRTLKEMRAAARNGDSEQMRSPS